MAQRRADAARGGLDACRAREAHRRRKLHVQLALEPMLERAGFEIRPAVYGADQVSAAYVCVKPGDAPR
jgi:hypothetical protein